MKKIKVLVSAYACEPGKGSEPGVGWNWSKQIAKFAEVWVITRANNKVSIEKELQKNPEPNLYFLYYDVPKWLSFWKKKKRGVHQYYLLWQIGAYQLARRIHEQIHFDIVHHLTFGNIWLPTFMPFLSIPFIWGPLGGGEQVPKVFRKDFDAKARLKEIIRDVIVVSLKFNLLFLYASRKAHLIIAKTSDTARRIPVENQNRVIVTTDVAINPIEFKQKNKNNSEMKIIAVGNLEPWRGFDLLIKAFSIVAKEHIEIKLLILGEGGDRRRLTRICKENDLTGRVIFTGQVTQQKYMQYLADSAFFVNPCLKEGGVTALFDALSLGLPVICMDVPGSSEIVNEDCGIKIKVIHSEQIVKDLAQALQKIITIPDLRQRMGEAGRKRVHDLCSWDRKGELIRNLYAKVSQYE